MQLVKRSGAWALSHWKVLLALLVLKAVITIPGLYYFGYALPLPAGIKTFPSNVIKTVAAKVGERARERGLEMLRLQNGARENDPQLCAMIAMPSLNEEEQEALFYFLVGMQGMAYLAIEKARSYHEEGGAGFAEAFEKAASILQKHISFQNRLIQLAQARQANEIQALVENVVIKPRVKRHSI